MPRCAKADSVDRAVDGDRQMGQQLPQGVIAQSPSVWRSGQLLRVHQDLIQ